MHYFSFQNLYKSVQNLSGSLYVCATSCLRSYPASSRGTGCLLEFNPLGKNQVYFNEPKEAENLSRLCPLHRLEWFAASPRGWNLKRFPRNHHCCFFNCHSVASVHLYYAFESPSVWVLAYNPKLFSCCCRRRILHIDGCVADHMLKTVDFTVAAEVAENGS